MFYCHVVVTILVNRGFCVGWSVTLCDREQDLLSRDKSLIDSWLSAAVTV